MAFPFWRAWAQTGRSKKLNWWRSNCIGKWSFISLPSAVSFLVTFWSSHVGGGFSTRLEWTWSTLPIPSLLYLACVVFYFDFAEYEYVYGCGSLCMSVHWYWLTIMKTKGHKRAQWILLMDLLKLICLSVIAKLVGLKWGDGNMNHYA